MNPLFYYFVLAIVLGALWGYYYHEAQEEKIRYERDSCYEKMNNQRTFQNIDNFSEAIIYGTEN